MGTGRRSPAAQRQVESAEHLASGIAIGLETELLFSSYDGVGRWRQEIAIGTNSDSETRLHARPLEQRNCSVITLVLLHWRAVVCGALNACIPHPKWCKQLNCHGVPLPGSLTNVEPLSRPTHVKTNG